MIFNKLADFIIKHAKLVLIVWVIILAASAYPALHSSEKLSYDMGSMGGKTTESVDGALIISEHFSTMVDTETVQMLLITYDKDDTAAAAAATTAVDYIVNKINVEHDYKKIASAMDRSSDDGLKLIAFIYGANYTEEIADDTGNLRSYLHDQIKASGADESKLITYVAGTPAIAYDASEAMTRDLSIVDPISIFLILVLVGLFFRSFVSSAAPPITIGVAFALVMCSLFFIAQMMDIFYIVEMLLLVSMLGAGCDYCIFILSRYREERRSGREHLDACREAIMWAGESVFTSGLAVMIGFGSMILCDFQLVSTIGFGLALGIVFALLAALTLMSSLIVLLGDRLFWPTGASGEKTQKGYLKKMGHIAHVYFTKSTHFSIKHAKAIIIATILFTVPMFYVYSTSENSYDMIGSMMTGESSDGMQVMTNYGDAGSTMPNYAVIETNEPMAYVDYIGGTENGIGMLVFNAPTVEAVKAANTELASKVIAIDDNVATAGPTMNLDGNWKALITSMGIPLDMPFNTFITLMESQPQYAALAGALKEKLTPEVQTQIQQAMEAQGKTMSWIVGDTYVGYIMDWAIFVATGSLGTTVVNENAAVCNYYQFQMVTKDQAMANKSLDTVHGFSKAVHEFADGNATIKTVWITGTAAVMMEISDEMNAQFIKIEVTAVILIIILLLFVMKSYLTPIRSVATILMSVVWTLAITHLLFTDLLGAGVLWILPIMLLVICLGLGMDYDILLTTRIREYRFAKGMSNDEAISQAVLHSGSVITVCGFIMAGTFGTMMLSSTVMLQQMGFALAFAILVDALVVRTYIVPAAMHLMGEWNWKGPAFLQRENGIGRRTGALLGLVAAIVMIVCVAVATGITQIPFDAIDMDALMDYNKDTEMLTKVAFGVGGGLTLVFGAFIAKFNGNICAKASGIAFIASGILMLTAALGHIEGITSDHMWIIASGVTVAAGLLYAGFLAMNRHAVGAGLMTVAILGIAGAALAEAMTMSFGLAVAAIGCVLVASLCEMARLN